MSILSGIYQIYRFICNGYHTVLVYRPLHLPAGPRICPRVAITYISPTWNKMNVIRCRYRHGWGWYDCYVINAHWITNHGYINVFLVYQQRGYITHAKAYTVRECFNSSPHGQSGRHFADDIFRCIFVNEKFHILIKISLKFVPKGPVDNNAALV